MGQATPLLPGKNLLVVETTEALEDIVYPNQYGLKSMVILDESIYLSAESSIKHSRIKQTMSLHSSGICRTEALFLIYGGSLLSSLCSCLGISIIMFFSAQRNLFLILTVGYSTQGIELILTLSQNARTDALVHYAIDLLVKVILMKIWWHVCALGKLFHFLVVKFLFNKN